MPMSSPPPSETALVRHVIDACQNAIKQAVTQPSRVNGLANGLGAALRSLQLIQSEVAKGSAGASVIIDNADALTRNALSDVLRIASQPDDALAALAAVSDVAPPAPSPAFDPTSRPRGRPAPATHCCRFSMKSRRPTSTCASSATVKIMRTFPS